jgi:hypothetical protein
MACRFQRPAEIGCLFRSFDVRTARRQRAARTARLGRGRCRLGIALGLFGAFRTADRGRQNRAVDSGRTIIGFDGTRGAARTAAAGARRGRLFLHGPFVFIAFVTFGHIAAIVVAVAAIATLALLTVAAAVVVAAIVAAFAAFAIAVVARTIVTVVAAFGFEFAFEAAVVMTVEILDAADLAAAVVAAFLSVRRGLFFLAGAKSLTTRK